MKKIWIFVALAMVIVMVTSAMSHTFDFYKPDKDDDETSTVTSTNTSSTSEPPLDTVSFDEHTFYYEYDGEYVPASELVEVQNYTSGFFISGNKTYFCFKHYGADGMLYTADVTSKSGNYSLTSSVSSDLETVYDVTPEEYECPGDYVYIYYVAENCTDPLSLNELLTEDVSFEVVMMDPEIPEGPSAE